jgi:hypothetical protein
MKTILTPYLLGTLIEQGYTYMLAKTENVIKEGSSISIKLMPVKYKPYLEELPLEYDTYFKITREPMQMACGVDDTEVLLINYDLNKDLYSSSVLKKDSRKIL